MGELIAVLFAIVVFVLFLKLFVLLAKAGIFLLLLPFKILFAVIGAVLSVVFLDIFAVPVLVVASVFLIPLLLIIGGLMLVLK